MEAIVAPFRIHSMTTRTVDGVIVKRAARYNDREPITKRRRSIRLFGKQSIVNNFYHSPKQYDANMNMENDFNSSWESEIDMRITTTTNKRKKTKKNSKKSKSIGFTKRDIPIPSIDEDVVVGTDDIDVILDIQHAYPELKMCNTYTTLSAIATAKTVVKHSVTMESEIIKSQCSQCRMDDDPHKIILCFVCNAGWHCKCVIPALSDVPEGVWHCPDCQQHQMFVSSEKKQIQEDDFADIKLLKSATSRTYSRRPKPYAKSSCQQSTNYCIQEHNSQSLPENSKEVDVVLNLVETETTQLRVNKNDSKKVIKTYSSDRRKAPSAKVVSSNGKATFGNPVLRKSSRVRKSNYNEEEYIYDRWAKTTKMISKCDKP